MKRVPSSATAPSAPIEVGGAGQRRRHVLGKDRHGHRLHEVDGARREAIDVAGHHQAGITRDRRGDDGRLLIDVVHVQQARRDDGPLGDLVVAQVELLVAIPEDDALARDLVHHDHGVLVAGVLDDRVGAVDAVVRQFLPDAPAVVVGAGGAEVLGPQAEAGAGHEGRGHLAAAADRLAADPHLRERAARLRHGRQAVDEIDGVGPEADHIPAGV
jgi:hypothetical protein